MAKDKDTVEKKTLFFAQKKIYITCFYYCFFSFQVQFNSTFYFNEKIFSLNNQFLLIIIGDEAAQSKFFYQLHLQQNDAATLKTP